MALCALNNVAKKHFIRAIAKDSKEDVQNIKNSYAEMVASFDQSQEILRGLRFCVVYDMVNRELVIEEKEQKDKKTMYSRMSYFSDFIFY